MQDQVSYQILSFFNLDKIQALNMYSSFDTASKLHHSIKTNIAIKNIPLQPGRFGFP